ncbi:MAG: hypothetical protein ACRDEA_18340, partial [Microcystaceae cyanobacterium]
MALAKENCGSIQNQVSYLQAICNHSLDFIQTTRVSRQLQNLYAHPEITESGLPSIRLAILASSTVDHLPPAIQVAALRRGLMVHCYIATYGQYRQEILNPTAKLSQFAPDVVLLALNAQEAGIKLPLTASLEEVTASVENRVEDWVKLWQTVTQQLSAVVMHQTMVVAVEQIFGNYDVLVPAAPANILSMLNDALRKQAIEHQVLLVDIDALAASVGKQSWCDHPLWYHSKQDISPIHAPLYGEQVARILAAIRGLSRKCLALDLDNTLWGGVIGDDGLAGIQLGQGSGIGEAYQAFQAYAKALKDRGIILAVCSKNDESNALEPFVKHPEMLLRRE